MLEANINQSFDKLFYLYNSLYLIRKHFRYVGISGELLPQSVQNRPHLYLMNHSSWWDGLLAYHAVRSLTGNRHYFMMDEEQLKKYMFFRKLGAFSINRHSAGDIGASLRYTAGLLRNNQSVWMYPEGEIQPLEHRPLVIKPGAAVVLRLCPEAVVIPVTLYHGLFRHSKPEATLLVGEPLVHTWKEIDRGTITNKLQDTLVEQLEAHRNMMIHNGGKIPESFQPLMKQGKSTNEWFDAFRVRARQ